MVRLTKQSKALIFTLALFLFFGLFFKNESFTGMYLLDFQQEYCSADKDCQTGEACCYFYEEDMGICSEESNCKAIQKITKEEKEKLSSGQGLEQDYKFTESDRLRVTKRISASLEKPSATIPRSSCS